MVATSSECTCVQVSCCTAHFIYHTTDSFICILLNNKSKTIKNIGHAGAGTRKTDTFASILFLRAIKWHYRYHSSNSSNQPTKPSLFVTCEKSLSLKHGPPIKDNNVRQTFCKGDHDQCSVHKHGVSQMLRYSNRLGLLEPHKTNPRCHRHGRITGERREYVNIKPFTAHTRK